MNENQPTSKGKGWIKNLFKHEKSGIYHISIGRYEIDEKKLESFIQAVIDEAVEDGKKIAVKEMRQKVLRCGGLGGMKHLDELLASVLNH